jgi:EAL domain-containing protein (putative c-di-GMP-specific phosphodiesterase class I)
MTPQDRARLLNRVGPLAIRHATGDIAPLLHLTLTLAIAPAQLSNSVFVEKIAGTLGATNFPANRLQLALDAPVLPAPSQLGGSISDLRRRGVAITLSEFALADLPGAYLDAGLIDRVRLAATLLESAGPARDAYLAASLEAARAAGLAVTVPGVARKDQASRLLRLGCREFQGELLARPMPIAAFTQLALAPVRPAEVKRAS